jgi:dCTP deaminase
MILSQVDLRKSVSDGEIGFSPPLEESQWGEASIDLRLGFQFTKFRPASGITISVADGLKGISHLGMWDTKELKSDNGFGSCETYELEPNGLVLALTHETISIPRNMIGLVEGRSTYARMGLTMHQTAPWIQPGWSGPIVLEIANHGPFTIKLTPLVDRPCQLTFFQLSSGLPAEMAYGSREGDAYQNQNHPLVHGKSAS